MLRSDWKYVETVQKRVRSIKVDLENNSINVLDLDTGRFLSFNVVNKQINLGKVKRAKIYNATVKVFEAEFTEELEHQMLESALNNPHELKKVQAFKESGAKPTRFDLTALTH